MTALLICPSAPSEMRRLADTAPLPAIPFLGRSIVEYWLAHLAVAKRPQVRILAHDRPEQIATAVGPAARWGLDVEVIAESRELSADEAEMKYAEHSQSGELQAIVLDRFPGMASPLFGSYADLFAGLLDWMPRARTEDRVGVKELKPGVWTGLQARISPTAILHAPCWIGDHAYVGAKAVIGPRAVIEDRAFVESGTEISGSVIGPDTFVGRLATVQDSFAWGNLLISWKFNSAIEVPDPFLLSALRKPAGSGKRESFLARWIWPSWENRSSAEYWTQFQTSKGG